MHSNIKVHVEETDCEVVYWILLAKDSVQLWGLVNILINLQVS
jgi:hypothetical protein